MNKTEWAYIGLLLLGTFIASVSQVLLKKASMKKYDSVIQEYINPLVICAYILFAGTTFLSVIAYKEVPLSLGPVLEATSYIYVTFFGVKIFKERQNRKKIAALLLIVAGIAVAAIFG